jgi:hypothetical protein
LAALSDSVLDNVQDIVVETLSQFLGETMAVLGLFDSANVHEHRWATDFEIEIAGMVCNSLP